MRRRHTLPLAMVAALLSGGCLTTEKAAKTPENPPREQVRVEVDPNQKPPAANAAPAERLYTYNHGPQPIIKQPDVLIIGETGNQDPSNPNVWRGGRTDYVVVSDWQWNEDALRTGSDLKIPGTRQPIEQLYLQKPEVQTRVVNAERPTINVPEPARAAPQAPTDDLIKTETQAAPDDPSVSANQDGMELPQETEAPPLFLRFLAEKGEYYYGLRKELRTLGYYDRSKYDQAALACGPGERLGFLPDYGWCAFEIKKWKDLSRKERDRWINSKAYRDFVAQNQDASKPPKDRDGNAPTATQVEPQEYKVKLEKRNEDGSVVAEPSKPNP